ncbi:UNVERIFIED_CONTAM: hypothetical protein PYX00_003490 [Menopon gallinae]|uniref:FHA domain-containing protein n=1 Tax=Menopon gallinae TaxID=328185 RepID=A0AAW2I1R7_9NEOP
MSSESLTQPLEDQRSPSDDSENVKRFCYVIVNDIWNEINAGDTIVGRDASLCSIVISDNTLSKVHAIIESEGAEDTFIYDVGSTNGTKMGRMVLKPHCRYKLNDNDTIVLGSTSIQFKIVNHKVNSNNNLSPLNTGGKSQSFENHTYFCNEPSTSNKNTPAKLSLSTPVRHQKKFYYKTDSDSSLVDIFNQPTQCTKKNVDQDLSDDEIDIYNLTTQCDFLEKSACSKISQTSQSDKAEEDIKCSINNSGTFSFVNNSKSKKCIISDECKSVDDIFDLATQCQLNEDVEAISDSSNAKKKVSEDLKTLNCVDTSHKLADNSENGHCNRNPDLVKCSESLLCDGEDDALCEVMKTYSQQSVTNYSDIPLKTLISQSEKISSDEIFDTPTQVCVDGNGTEFKEGVSSYKAHNKSKDSEDPVKDRNEAGAFQSTTNNLEKDTDNYIDEDLVLTQDFNASFKVPKAVSQKQCKTSVSESGSHIKGKKSDTDDVYRLLQEDADLEDLIATQIFKADNVSNKEKEDKSSQNNCSQDDVATQIFSRNITGGELENIVPEKTAGSPSRNGIPMNDTSGIIGVSDSGDETESDIEEKLCIESNKGQLASIVNKTAVKSGSSSTRVRN